MRQHGQVPDPVIEQILTKNWLDMTDFTLRSETEMPLEDQVVNRQRVSWLSNEGFKKKRADEAELKRQQAAAEEVRRAEELRKKEDKQEAKRAEDRAKQQRKEERERAKDLKDAEAARKAAEKAQAKAMKATGKQAAAVAAATGQVNAKKLIWFCPMWWI